jgi:hypothetical protein
MAGYQAEQVMSRLYKSRHSKTDPFDIGELKKQLVYVDIRKH